MAMILLMAFLDMLGVASILPFMAVLADPNMIQTNTLLNGAFTAGRHIGIHTTEHFLFALGVLVFVLLVTSLSFKAFVTHTQTHFVLMREFSIAKRLMEGYLCQPYTWFLDRHSADLGKNILSEVETVIYNGMLPFVILVAQGTVAVTLLLLLVLIDPLLALSITGVLGSSYACILLFVSSRLKRLGRERIQANQERFTVVNETFGAVKELKVGGFEEVYLGLFSKPAEIFAKSQASTQLISQLPRFLLEAAAFGGLLLVVLYLMAEGESLATTLPVISLYAFAGYRLMPALQQIYGALTQLRFVGTALDALYRDFSDVQKTDFNVKQSTSLTFNKAIQLQQVNYCYPKASNPTLKGIDLNIPIHSTIGFMGSTGSGKTTLVDVILGLLEPQEGCLSVDGQTITAANRRSWQSLIGYVPQHINLVDGSIAANIALGVPAENIDHEAVMKAAKIANLHDFVVRDLSQTYATGVGERGVRLSGGQRQRIGIARALYHKPQVLVLDEATSALDIHTEQVVMEAINHLSHAMTVILIAHRLNTLRQCDQIYLLEGGRVKASGTYQELINSK
jgi:ABC-type bacteriocin/lantibiotic exporter with double-glycine peptidase domain